MIARAALHRVTMPMRRPFGHARATRNEAEGVVVRLDVDAIQGVGECAPRAYVTGETLDSAFAALARIDLAAIAGSIAWGSFRDGVRSIERLDLPARLRDGQARGLAASCALELALLDALAKRFACPLHAVASALDLPPTLLRDEPGRWPISRVLDAGRTPEELLAESRVAHHVKIKVGLGRERDVARVRAVREGLGPRVSISVDANMAWSLEEAVATAKALEPYAIAWFEEPVAQGALDAARAFRERSGARVMLDESLCTFADAEAAIAARACDAFNIRLSKCGGLIPSLRLAALATSHRLAFQIGVQVAEMGPLWAAGRHFGAAVRGFSAFEAGTADQLFEEQLVAPPSVIDRETFLVREPPGFGLGVTIRDEVLERFTTRRATYDGRRWS